MRRMHILAVGAVIVTAIVLVAWSGDEQPGGTVHYEVRPTIRNPQYRSDTARAIDAYERLMERYMDLTQSNLLTLQTDLREMTHRMSRLETLVVQLNQTLGVWKQRLRTRRLRRHRPPRRLPNDRLDALISAKTVAQPPRRGTLSIGTE